MGKSFLCCLFPPPTPMKSPPAYCKERETKSSFCLKSVKNSPLFNKESLNSLSWHSRTFASWWTWEPHTWSPAHLDGYTTCHYLISLSPPRHGKDSLLVVRSPVHDLPSWWSPSWHSVGASPVPVTLSSAKLSVAQGTHYAVYDAAQHLSGF